MIHYYSFFRILRWLRDEEELKNQKLPNIEFLIVDLSRKYMTNLSYLKNKTIFYQGTDILITLYLLLTAVIDIDTSGIHALEELLKTLEKRKIQVKCLK
jgi:sulfate transporter 1, high-affinity